MYLNPLMSITLRKPLNLTGSRLTLLSCEIYCLSPVNEDPLSKDIFFTKVNSVDQKGEGQSAGMIRSEHPLRAQRFVHHPCPFPHLTLEASMKLNVSMYLKRVTIHF